jgi:hypothetical protein
MDDWATVGLRAQIAAFELLTGFEVTAGSGCRSDGRSVRFPRCLAKVSQ